MTLRRFLFAALVCCHLAGIARAVVFDWDAAYGTWGGAGNDPGTGATATRNFDNDATHSGNDVTIAVSNLNTGGSGFSWGGNGVSVDNTPLQGGTSQNALQFEVNDHNATGIRTTITFNYTGGVTNVSFTIWDVDKTAGQWIDVISAITAQTVGGATIGPTSVTGGSDNTVSGSGTGFVVTGTGDADNGTNTGNVTISFTGVAITSITFNWRNTDPGQGQQFIALHDINYTPVPEVGTSLGALGLCVGLVGATMLRKRPNRTS